MYGCAPQFGSDADKILFEFDRETPAPNYVWQSLPLKLPSEDRMVNVREVVLRASNPWQDTAPAITVLLIDALGNTQSTNTWNLVVGPDGIQEQRLNARCLSTEVTVQIQASGALYAPVLASIGLGHKAREHVGVN
jgi:hypothetical protein